MNDDVQPLDGVWILSCLQHVVLYKCVLID